MKETGILMTPDNHRAIRDKRKWQTRRVIVPQPKVELFPFIGRDDRPTGEFAFVDHPRVVSKHVRCPYGVPGDLLYVKEGVIVQQKGWSPFTGKDDGSHIGYYMDGRRVENAWDKRLTAMFMAKRYARTWLEITDVRDQHLQEISDDDAIAEGIYARGVVGDDPACATWTWKKDGWRYDSPREAYKELWESINRKKHPWSSNPFCWCLTFKMIRC